MLASFWRFLTFCGRALMAARVSLLSALGGLILFGGVLQAQNLFADLSDAWHYWPLFFFAVFFVWAFPVHYGARRVLDDDGWLAPARLRREIPASELKKLATEWKGLVDWLPRVLGVVPFVAVGLGLYFADRAMDGARALPDSSRAHDQIVALGLADFVTGVVFVIFVYFRRPALDRLISHIDGPRDTGAKKGRMETLLDIFARASLVGTALVFVAAYFFPFGLTTWIERAKLVPFLFGSLVLAFSLLVRIGDRRGFPVLAPLLAFCLLVTAFNVHFNDVRQLRPDPATAGQRQIEVADAIARWRAANGCADAPQSCPAALIVAAEGGASRAAFMEATLLGEIMDRASAPEQAPGRKIFAISGVSGGAYGGAVIRAALADATEAGNAPPCRVTPALWFGADKLGKPDPRTSWRSCLQVLVSGDYLSSGFVGLGFRDNLAPRQWFGGAASWIEDRAALLEQSWEAYFEQVAGRPAAPCAADARQGLCRRLGYAKELGKGQWAPLLLLNGTSVETGRRIIATDLVSTTPDPKGGTGARLALYAQAFDLFELLAAPAPEAAGKTDGGAKADDAPDVRLSTAALLSARFPIISPAGVLRTTADNDQGDRVVDGGYFENAGLTTAVDLALAVQREGVTPAILWVQNDPIETGVATPPRPAATPPVGPLDESWATAVFGVLASPFDALAATRNGHGAEAADVAVQTLARLNGPDRLGWFTIGVKAQPTIAPAANDPSFEAECGRLVKEIDGKPLSMTKVSMSWWLSAGVQADLDAQICDKDNRGGLNDLMQFLSKPR